MIAQCPDSVDYSFQQVKLNQFSNDQTVYDFQQPVSDQRSNGGLILRHFLVAHEVQQITFFSTSCLSYCTFFGLSMIYSGVNLEPVPILLRFFKAKYCPRDDEYLIRACISIFKNQVCCHGAVHAVLMTVYNLNAQLYLPVLFSQYSTGIQSCDVDFHLYVVGVFIFWCFITHKKYILLWLLF